MPAPPTARPDEFGQPHQCSPISSSDVLRANATAAALTCRRSPSNIRVDARVTTTSPVCREKPKHTIPKGLPGLAPPGPATPAMDTTRLAHLAAPSPQAALPMISEDRQLGKECGS